MVNKAHFESDREDMVKNQIISRGVHAPRVLQALRKIPRHRFVLPDYQHLAYSDGPLPIGHGQTISQPYIVALMTELLELRGDEKVLEIGAGSGYQAAILSQLAHQVYTIERHEELATLAKETIHQLGIENVHMQIGDGSLGLPEFAPYEAILVTAAAPKIPQALLDQLKDQGRLVIPVGRQGSQSLERWRRKGNDLSKEEIIPVAFVPLIGEQGWEES
jgi:protein-L-isoaspartate(D-aspartate) O-methyltransferase